ncbi:MAG: CRTAC1 family protein [Isosphaeraceae bacterium]
MVPRRGIALLSVLLAIYGISVAYRSFSARGLETANAPISASDLVFDPPRDLGWVRANPTVPVERSPFRFTEIARSAGIDFVHVSGMTEVKHFPTAYGSGVAMFDFDDDGKLDLYFATATQLPPGTAPSGPNRLYRNLGKGRFEDATQRSGLGFAGYCQGLVVGDIDNDGDQDVFLCNYGTNVLYRNNGDGTFRDISKAAGINRPEGWSTAGAFLDYDQDGDLDLYVARFGHWKIPDDVRFCGGPKAPGMPGPEQVHIYCSPRTIRPARHILYRNNGDGTFTDTTEPAGLGRTDGRGLGVVAADLNDDGRIDLYVANDTCPNFVFLNRGDGTFEDVTDSSGAGYDADGRVRAGMGVDAEDVNGDGRPDLFVTNYFDEPNALFINLGGGRFEERTRSWGMMHDSLLWVGWGCALADFDNDGWPDCFVSNGHVDDNLHLFDLKNPYAQPALLHRNREGKRFELATRDAGAYFDSDHVGRGVAYGDLDNDGDIDLVVNHKDGPPALLRNDTETRNHWIRLRLEGTRSNRDAVGARVEIEAGERTIVRQRKGGSSYASAHDPRLLIGLGDAPRAQRITVRWPSGRVDLYLDTPAGADVVLREKGE